MKRTIFTIILLFTLIHVGDTVDNLSSQRLFGVIKSEKTICVRASERDPNGLFQHAKLMAQMFY